MSGAEAAGRGRRPRVAAGELAAVSILTFDLYACVMTQKFAIPLGAAPETQVAAALPIHALCMFALARRGDLRFVPERLVAFCLFAAWSVAMQVRFVGGTWSPTSLGQTLAIASLLTVATRIGPEAYAVLAKRFVALALIAAALVGADWAVQAAGLPFPDFERLQPASLVYHAYNYIQPLKYGSPWTKANGVVFLETSHASQFIAMGLVVETALFRRPLAVAGLLAGLMGTFGGTGLTLVALCAPFLVARAGPKAVLAILVAAPVVLVAAGATGYLADVERRSGEFSQGTSSGYNRFVLPLEWARGAVDGPAEDAWLGTGAGSMPKSEVDDARGGYAWPPYTKVLVEYGIPGLALFTLLIATSLFGTGVPVAIAMAAAVQYNLLNGSLAVPIHTVYCVILCSGTLLRARVRARPSPALNVVNIV